MSFTKYAVQTELDRFFKSLAQSDEPFETISKPIQIFQSLPVGHGRKEVNDEMDKVRRFRNRIKHNEPICFNGNNIDFTATREVHKSITNLLTWIDPEIIKLISDIDKVKKTIDKAKTI